MNDNCEKIVVNANLWAENQQLKEKLLNEQREYEGLYKVLNKKEEEWKKFLYNQAVEKSKLQSNWNSLREWLEIKLSEPYQLKGPKNERILQQIIQDILDKMNELEGENNNGK